VCVLNWRLADHKRIGTVGNRDASAGGAGEAMWSRGRDGALMRGARRLHPADTLPQDARLVAMAAACSSSSSSNSSPSAHPTLILPLRSSQTVSAQNSVTVHSESYLHGTIHGEPEKNFILSNMALNSVDQKVGATYLILRC